MSGNKVDPVTAQVAEFHQRVMERAEIISRAFAQVGVAFDEREKHLLRAVADWGHFVDPNLKFQDTESRKLVEMVLERAEALSAALQDVWEYGGLEDEANDEGEKVNVCEWIFGLYPDEASNHFKWCLYGIEVAARQALANGRVLTKRGRPPLLAYYGFVRQLHELFVWKAGKKGFYEKDGAAHGPFIDLVVEAQQILPDSLRLRERTTIANRVLQAFTVEIPD